MNYKYFRMMSEDDGMNGGSAEPNGEPNEGGQEPKSFDDLLKESDYQSEFDRRVTKAINTAVTKERARLEALHNEQLTEAEKLAKMTETEKNEYKAQQKEKFFFYLPFFCYKFIECIDVIAHCIFRIFSFII